MHYTQFFRSLREKKQLSLEELARQAQCHRNTVINVESGRPVKFKTIAELMGTMGFAPQSAEMRTIGLLWAEAATGIALSRPEVRAAAQKAIDGHRAPARQAARRLEAALTEAGLEARQIDLLAYAARSPEMLAILDSVRALVEGAGEAAPEEAGPERLVAEEP